MIRTQGLTKRFGALTAVEALDLAVHDGDVFGFLGANGSGKTTTVRMLLGLVLATSGTMEVLGRAMPAAAGAVLPQVGALVERPAAYPHLSGRRNLSIFDAMGRGAPRRTRAGRVDDALQRVGLGDVDRRPVRAYSLGMQQRLGLAVALLRRPRLLVLDEPTNGLDPQGISEIRTLLLQLNAEGTTIFLSSHLLAEVELMCSRVAVLDRGRLVLQEELEVLRQPTGRVEILTPDTGAALRLLGDRATADGDGRLYVRHEDPAALNSALVSSGVRVHGVKLERHTLEEVVLAASAAAGTGQVR